MSESISAQPIDVLGKDFIRDGHSPGVEQLDDAVQIPVLRHVGLRMGGHYPSDLMLHHLHAAVMHVSPLQNVLAIGVDDAALSGNDVVIFDDVLADIKIEAFNLALRRLEHRAHGSGLDGHIFFHAHPFHPFCRPIGPEAAHQLVFQREEEARLTWIALAARATAKLIIDSPGLMPLGADDVEPPRGDDFLMILVTARLVASTNASARSSGVANSGSMSRSRKMDSTYSVGIAP